METIFSARADGMGVVLFDAHQVNTWAQKAIMEGMVEETFRELHSPQLQAIGFPATLVTALYSKLAGAGGKASGDDLSQHFNITSVGSSDNCSESVSSSTGSLLRSKAYMPPESEVFIVPHAWESDGGREGRQQLMKDPQLLAKIETLLGIAPSEQSEDRDSEKIKEEMIEFVCKQSGKSRSVAEKALLDSGYDTIAAIVAAESLDEADCQAKEEASDPPITFDEFKKGLTSVAGSSAPVQDSDARYVYEDYLGKRTAGPVEDDSGWVHCDSYSWTNSSEEEEGVISVEVALPTGTGKRDVTSKLQVRCWKLEVRGRTGGKKVIIDRGFSAPVIPDESFWTLDKNVLNMTLQKAHPDEKWASLFTGEVQLGPNAAEKMATLARQRLVGRVQRVMEKMWLVNQTYQAVTPEGEQKPVWYLMDQYGLSLTHSDHPNFLCKPFANAVTGKVMTLIWPVRGVKEGEVCTRDFVPLLHPSESPEQHAARKDAILNTNTISKMERFHAHAKKVAPAPFDVTRPRHSPKKIEFSNLSKALNVFLSEKDKNTLDWASSTLEGYILVDSPNDADIVLGEVTPVLAKQLQASNRVFARLPGDDRLVTKIGLCELTQGKKRKDCFVQSLDLSREAAELLRYHEDGGLVESWRVVLPGRRGVSVEPRVTRNVVEMVRCVENGPCTASQFCVLSVLHGNRRCCLQYPVVAKPPQVFMHHTPRIRLAEAETKEGFDPWESDALLSSPTRTVQWEKFLRQFTTKYKASWSQVRESVNTAVRELFTLALPLCAPEGVAVYTVDILVKYPSLSPVVIGVDALPAFPSAAVAEQCLDLLVGRRKCSEQFIQLLPL